MTRNQGYKPSFSPAEVCLGLLYPHLSVSFRCCHRHDCSRLGLNDAFTNQCSEILALRTHGPNALAQIGKKFPSLTLVSPIRCSSDFFAFREERGIRENTCEVSDIFRTVLSYLIGVTDLAMCLVFSPVAWVKGGSGPRSSLFSVATRP